MLRWNILQYLTKILRQYFNCNEILEIFLTSFCNILCYVGDITEYFVKLSVSALHLPQNPFSAIPPRWKLYYTIGLTWPLVFHRHIQPFFAVPSVSSHLQIALLIETDILSPYDIWRIKLSDRYLEVTKLAIRWLIDRVTVYTYITKKKT